MTQSNIVDFRLCAPVRALALLALLALSGCATIERHPYATAVVTAVVAGSIAASVQHHHDQGRVELQQPPAMSNTGQQHFGGSPQ